MTSALLTGDVTGTPVLKSRLKKSRILQTLCWNLFSDEHSFSNVRISQRAVMMLDSTTKAFLCLSPRIPQRPLRAHTPSCSCWNTSCVQTMPSVGLSRSVLSYFVVVFHIRTQGVSNRRRHTCVGGQKNVPKLKQDDPFPSMQTN